MYSFAATGSQHLVGVSVLMSLLFVAVLSSAIADAYPNSRAGSSQSALSSAASGERVTVGEEDVVSGVDAVARAATGPQRPQPAMAGREGTFDLCLMISRILESTSCGSLHQPCLSLQAQAQVLEKCQRWRAYALPPGSHHSDPYDGVSDNYDLNALHGAELEELRTIRTAMERELEARWGWGLWSLFGAAAAGMALGWAIALASFHARARGMMMNQERAAGNGRWRAVERNSSGLLLPVIKE